VSLAYRCFEPCDSFHRLARTPSLVGKNSFEKLTQMLDDNLKFRYCELVSGSEGGPLNLLRAVTGKLVRQADRSVRRQLRIAARESCGDGPARRWDWLASTDYQITDNTLGYFTVATGSRPPGITWQASAANCAALYPANTASVP
jgi:hypothetical protein